MVLQTKFHVPRCSAPQDEDEEELECERQAPGNLASDVREAVIDPIDDHKPEDVHHHLKHNQLASPLRLGGLRLPHRCRGGVDAIPNARDNPSHNHLRGTESARLQGTSNRHNSRSNEDSLFPTESLADSESYQGAEEAAHVVDCCDDG